MQLTLTDFPWRGLMNFLVVPSNSIASGPWEEFLIGATTSL